MPNLIATIVWIATLSTGHGLSSPNVMFPTEQDCRAFVNQTDMASYAARGMTTVKGVCARATVLVPAATTK